MNIYLDDDTDADILISLLKKAGHGVVSPRTVGLQGQDDEIHLFYAAQNGLVLLTKNTKDFKLLQNLWRTNNRSHAGILLIFQENNPLRDMLPQQLVQAITRLEQAGVPLANECQNLNFWR